MYTTTIFVLINEQGMVGNILWHGRKALFLNLPLRCYFELIWPKAISFSHYESLHDIYDNGKTEKHQAAIHLIFWVHWANFSSSTSWQRLTEMVFGNQLYILQLSISVNNKYVLDIIKYSSFDINNCK